MQQLSSETLEKLEEARLSQEDYLPNTEVQQLLGDKKLLMVVAPSTMGKTQVMKAATLLDGEFERVSVFTTREARPDDDPGMFRYIPNSDNAVGEIIEMINARKPVQYAVHPTKGNIYGTMTEDYPATYNLLATMSGATEQLQKVGFKETKVIGLVTDPESWKIWLTERYPNAHDELQARLKEAVGSLTWLLDQTDIAWLYNQPNEITKNAQKLISIANNEQPDSTATCRQLAKECLAVAEGLLER